jgi:branched-chain amino acid transport system ATP-binding protein
MALLSLHGIGKSFGNASVIRSVSFSMEREIVALLGPNGAGKTTIFNIICGLLKPDRGWVEFNGRNVTDLSPSERCRLGIARVHQIPRPFVNMSVIENVMVGIHFGKDDSVSPGQARGEAKRYLDLVGLSDKANLPAGDLNTFERKMLELARAIATRPSLLLIDEIVAGASSSQTPKILEMILKVKEEFNTGILWVEHNTAAVERVAERILLLDRGELISEGRPQDIMKSTAFLQTYLGRGPG